MSGLVGRYRVWLVSKAEVIHVTPTIRVCMYLQIRLARVNDAVCKCGSRALCC